MKVLFSIFIVTLSLSAFAKIPEGCKPNIEDAIQLKNNFERDLPAMIASGELNHDDAKFIRQDHEILMQTVANLCSGLRLIELQRSVQNRLGLLTRQKANKEAKKSYDEAIAYYIENTKK